MKSYFRFMAFALLGLFLVSGEAYAAVTHTDGDIYGDAYTVENSSGNWTYAGNQTVQGNSTVTGTQTVTGNMTVSGTVTGKKNVTIINVPGDTSGTVTLAKSGYMFVLKPTGVAVGGVGYTLSLPSTNSTVAGSFTGERFTFTTATGSTLSIRCASATDATIYFGLNNTTRITSPSSSGSTVTLVGTGNSWYIESMGTGASTGGTQIWVAGTA